MRGQSARDIGWGTADNDCNLASEIEAGQIVVVLFGNGQAVSHEHKRSLHLRGKIDARAKEGIFAQRERLSFAVADESEARIFLDDLSRLKFHGLIITIAASRLHPACCN